MPRHERFINLANCGLMVREEADGTQGRVVVGTPIVFGVRSVNLTPWSSYREVYEVLEPGCISSELIQKSDVVFNGWHRGDVIFGRCVNGKGTLKLTLGKNQVNSECEMPNTTAANDMLELIKRGDITGMSFAFEDDEDDSENGVSYELVEKRNADGKEVWLRHVKSITRLHDVSIVTHPAYQQTSVSQREFGEEMMKRIDASVAKVKERDHNEDPTAEETARKEARRRLTETLLLT